MVGLSRHLEDEDKLIEKKERVREETKKLIQKDKSRIFTGKGDTKKNIQERIRLFNNMLTKIIEE